MAARCEAAGRNANEDNYRLSDNLSDNQWNFSSNIEVDLGDKGAMLVVCDGMGGMNAGEEASLIAVEVIKERFSPERLTDNVIADSDSIRQFIENAIIAADAKIKKEGNNNIMKQGMGSTIVLAWIIGRKVFVGWCGDSRAYRFNAALGLERLSHDHSYVQQLVDSGMLSEESAFNHPNSNIITRSLGEPFKTAQPEVMEYPLYDGDVIMLCSDGLSGVLRDNEMEEVMRQNSEDMESCLDTLWESARQADWNDNVTIGLCRIVSGCEQLDFASKTNAEQSPPQTERIAITSEPTICEVSQQPIAVEATTKQDLTKNKKTLNIFAGILLTGIIFIVIIIIVVRLIF